MDLGDYPSPQELEQASVLSLSMFTQTHLLEERWKHSRRKKDESVELKLTSPPSLPPFPSLLSLSRLQAVLNSIQSRPPYQRHLL